mgnify:CR=1 FL=1
MCQTEDFLEFDPHDKPNEQTFSDHPDTEIREEKLSKLKKEGKVEQLEFRFVINSYNYKEMIDFAKMAKKYGANVTFLNLLENEDTKEKFNELNVINPNHKKHNDFVKVLQNSIFKEPFIIINQELLNLKPINKSLVALLLRK